MNDAIKTSAVKDASLLNLAPDVDAIVIYVGHQWQIDVSRDEGGEVTVLLTDLVEGSQTTAVLGQEGTTQKC